MASELAMKLTKAGLDARDGSIQDALDAELAEVREVLDGLRYSEVGWCWCKGPGRHTEDCQRARALYEKLRIDK